MLFMRCFDILNEKRRKKYSLDPHTREITAAIAKRFREKNKDYCLAKSRNYYNYHKEQCLEYSREYTKKNSEINL